MGASPKIIRSRKRRIHRSENNFLPRFNQFALVVAIVVGSFISLGIIASTLAISSLSQNLPSLDTLPLLLDPPGGLLLEPTRLFDRSGEHEIAVLQYPAAEDQEYLPFKDQQHSDIPSHLLQATITASDPGFWTHGGFSWDLNPPEISPTLAQRLVSEHYLWNEPPSFQRAITERILAAQITSHFGRHKILEWFINSVKYGDFVYGADAAARVYFGKPAAELSLAESAVLAAAANSPNLLKFPLAAAAAKDEILAHMHQQELISTREYQRALQEEISFQPSETYSLDVSPVFTQLVINQAGEFFPPERIMRGGLSLITSMDFDLQSQAECTLGIQLERITGSTPRTKSYEECDMARLLPSQNPEGIIGDAPLDASLIILEPESGQILAIADDGELDIIANINTGHPPGTILTPFIYMNSFIQGMSPGTMVWDTAAALPEDFSDIENFDQTFHGPIRLRTALVNDYLAPTIQILSKQDPIQVWRNAQQLGLLNLVIPPGEGAYRLPLDGGQVTLLELSQAYGVFASQGILAGVIDNVDISENSNPPVHPQVILKVIEDSGESWLDCTNQLSDCQTIRRPVISPQLAYLVTNSLSDETARWPSLGHPNPLEIGRPVSAKIGRTESGDNAWTIGYTPELVAAVWMGRNNSDEGKVDISDSAAGLWHALIQYASMDHPVEEFNPPPGITEMKVCDPSGLLPTEECPRVVNEVFTHGNEPTQADNLYQTFLVNRETDRLATIFTPAELVEERVYMLVPPEAESWARQADIPTVPQAYDIMDPGSPQSSDARITSPEIFSAVKGTIPIVGRATGEEFSHYRLQIGSGLNPVSWLQLGDDVEKPVQNGTLGIWDTSGLSGLYALQLIVISEDDTVKTAIVQLTVDNQAPEVHIRFPSEGQEISKDDFEEITIQLETSDNLGIDRVELLMDGESLAILSSPPFAVPWVVTSGEHTLRVRVLDRAGNLSQASVEFVVEN